jgi:subfamily B ATP-binding cassette protein MsbA
VNPLHRLIGFARPYRGRFMLALAAMVLYAAASAGVVALIGPIFDEVLPDRERLAFWAWMVVAVYVAKGLGAYFSVYLMTDVGQRVVRDIRNRLFRHILDQSAGFFTRKSTGSLISRITNDVNQIQQVVSETLGDLLRESLALLGYAVWLFYLDWQLALVAVTGAPLAAYPLARFGQRIRSTTRRSQEEMEHLTHVTAERFHDTASDSRSRSTGPT